MNSWHGKVVLVTGASAGLGRAIAAAFAGAGAHLVLCARRQEELEAAAEAIRAAGGGRQVAAIQADVTRAEDVDRLLSETIERFGRLDVLVNNVGRSSRGYLLDVSPEELAELFELNVLSAVRCTRAAVPHLLTTGGHVVNIGSLAAKSASRYMGAYATTKFALAAYTQQLRLELSPQGVHVLLVCPGPIARRDEGSRYRQADAPGLAGSEPGGTADSEPGGTAGLAGRGPGGAAGTKPGGTAGLSSSAEVAGSREGRPADLLSSVELEAELRRAATERVALETGQPLPESAYRPGAGVKVKRIAPEQVAQAIVRACERRDPEIVLPGKARLLFALQQLSPKLGDWLLRRMT